MITLERAMECPFVKLLSRKSPIRKLASYNNILLATYLLQENNQIDFSPFAEYINTLPKSLSETPIFYSEDERVWLEGSPFFDKFNGRAEDIKRDHDLLC